VNWINGNWDNKEILINNAAVLFLFNALVTPTLRVLDVTYFYKLYQRKKLLNKLLTVEPEENDVSQREANEAFEGPRLLIDYYFAELSKTSLLTFFFIPIFPLSVIISTAGLIYTYWVDKVIFFNLDTAYL
jgi:hypothetical protein